MFLGLVLLCYFLQKNNLTDYVIVIVMVVIFLGIFTLSHVEVSSREVNIRKHYFWGVVGLRWRLTFDQLTAIKTKEYEIDTLKDTGMYIENFFTFFAFDALRPKARWLTTKLYYIENEKERDIELKISREDQWEIDRRIKPGRGLYAQFHK